jgi:hypothetical protein
MYVINFFFLSIQSEKMMDLKHRKVITKDGETYVSLKSTDDTEALLANINSNDDRQALYHSKDDFYHHQHDSASVASPSKKCPMHRLKSSIVCWTSTVFLILLGVPLLTLTISSACHTSSGGGGGGDLVDFPWWETIKGLAAIPFSLNTQTPRSGGPPSCAQVDALVPTFDANLTLDRFKNEKYILEAAEVSLFATLLFVQYLGSVNSCVVCDGCSHTAFFKFA